MNGSRTPAEFDHLVREAIARLEAGGAREGARILEKVRATAFTTSSEWLGELGLAVQQIKALGSLTPEVREKLDQISKVVGKVW